MSNAQASVAFLSGADDLLSRLLLDYSIFKEPKINGRATGKINHKARELRMTDSEVEKAKQLVSELRSGSMSANRGLETLLALPAVDQFTRKWDDVPLFSTHARRYILAFMPDCGIAFHETDRYKNPRAGVTARARKNLAAVTSRRDPATFIEVGVFATRNFKKGDVINLRGGIADLTEEEDDEMRLSGARSDFSVLWSERKNCFCLLLGPARFVNHDCRNNVEFNLVGSNMTFKVLEDIKQDEELFTHYGAHYFETDNAACLCATCEQLKQGAFTPIDKRKKTENGATPEPASPVKTVRHRASSVGQAPERSSSRASRLPPVNYNEKGPIASTSASATLVLKPTPGLARSKSLGSVNHRPRPPSSRMNPIRGALSVIDALRSKPRIVVQPKLAPPPGYLEHYKWDPKTKLARYIGPQESKDEEEKRLQKHAKRASVSLSKSTSNTNLGNKRQRTDSDSPAPVNSPRSKSAPAPKTVTKPRPARQSVTQARFANARVGKRRSGRLSVGTGPTDARKKSREDSSDLSNSEETQDEDDSGSEISEAGTEMASSSKAKRKGKARANEIQEGETSGAEQDTSTPARHGQTRSGKAFGSARKASSETPSSSISEGNARLRTVTLDLGFSTSTPMEEDRNPEFSQSHESGDVAPAEPQRKKSKSGPGPDPRNDDPHPPDKSPRGVRISTPNFYSKQTSSAEGGAGASNSNNTKGESSFCEAPSSAVSSGRGSYSQQATRAHNGSGTNRRSESGGGGGGGGGSDGDDEEDERRKKRNVPYDKLDEGGHDSQEEDEDEENDQKPVVDRDNADDFLETIPDSEPGSPSPELHENVGSSSAKRAPDSVFTNQNGKRPAEDSVDPDAKPDRHRPEETNAPSKAAPSPPPTFQPPKPKKVRTESSQASEDSAPRARSNIRWGKGKPGQRPAHIPPPPTRNPIPVQATPRAQVEPPRPRLPASVTDVKSKASINTIGTPKPLPARATPQPPAAGPIVGRQTRSKPIPGRLEDVLSAPETLAATGGYDWEKGRYITKHEQLRDPSSNPRPERRETESPSPEPSPRRRGRRTSSAAAVIPAAAAAPTPIPSSARAPTSASAPPPSIPTAAAPTRRSDSPNVIKKPVSRRRVTLSPDAAASRSASSPFTATATAVPPEGRRATRRSFPIAAPLRDIIYSSSALAATGGWDEESGRYVGASSTPNGDDSASSSNSTPAPKPRSSTTNANRSRSKSTTPRETVSSGPLPADPSPARTQSATATNHGSASRSTRRTNPINQRLDELVYSSAIGGWDPEKGKYVSQVAARKAANATSTSHDR
ncbi:uncharacterized protein JCM15063_005063 [Sporobolomyces koalae]|uniref:uncharacterized protein n=1 Tax=Sporobolomyces koalae TaxID=500713 RepID=UPI00316EB275